MEKIYTTKGTSDDGVDIAVGAFEANEGVSSNMREDVSLTHFDESQFAVVAVGEEVCRRLLTCILRAFMDPTRMKEKRLDIGEGEHKRTFQAVKASSQKAKGLVEILLSPSVLVIATKLDASAKKISHVLSGSHDIGPFVRNVIFHARLGIDGQLSRFINGPSKAAVILPSILVVGVVFGVVNVIFRAIAPKTVSSNLEFARTIAKGQETENAKEESDGFGRDRLDSADVDGLRIVSEPVAKVNSRDHDLVEFLMLHGTSHGQCEEGIFDITVSPCMRATELARRGSGNDAVPVWSTRTILALDFGSGSNVSSSKSCRWGS